MATWNKLDGLTGAVQRLAGLSLRAQRLVLAQRINRLEAMMRIHAPALTREPGGEARLQELTKTITQARTALQGLSDE